MNDEELESFACSMAEAARNIGALAEAITPSGVLPGRDETGGHVSCLTEAVMGVTAGLHRIAESIGELAEAVRETRGT